MKKQCFGCFEKYVDGLDICPHCGHGDGERPEAAIHLSPGRMLRNTYLIGKVLGCGGFGVTYLGWNTTLEHKVAIKEYLPNEFSTRMPDQTQVTVFNGEKSDQFHDGMERFIEEANRLAQFRDTDGIVRIYESFKENNTAYIVMEYLDGQTLTKHLDKTGKQSGDEAVRLMMPVIESLRLIHEEGIIHRDIAPDNIMVTTDGQVKLIDFGAARYATTSHSRSLTVVIKPGYSPEEQYRSRGDQGPWTDIYAIGATMYRMVTGQTPPDAMERRAFFEDRKKDILVPMSKFSNQINDNQQTAILNAMNVRIEDRTPDMGMFAQELNSDVEVKRRSGKIVGPSPVTWPAWLKALTSIAACILVTITVLFMNGIIGSPPTPPPPPIVPEGMVQVPSIVNNDVDMAQERINDQLVLQIIGKEESDDIPANLIMSQDLVAGTIVVLNSELKVVVSAGVEVDDTLMDEQGLLSLADVQYRTRDEAMETLESRQGMVVTITEEPSETVAAGIVISQYPTAGTRLEVGSEVALSVSMGRGAFVMPDVVGMDEDEAKEELARQGLVAHVEYIESNDIQAGNVVSQSIVEGTVLEEGENVTLVVSSGVRAEPTPTTPIPTPTPTPTPTPNGYVEGIVNFYDMRAFWIYDIFCVEFRCNMSDFGFNYTSDTTYHDIDAIGLNIGIVIWGSDGIQTKRGSDWMVDTPGVLWRQQLLLAKEGSGYVLEFEPDRYNLVPGQTYRWYAFVETNGGNYRSPTQSFTFSEEGPHIYDYYD